MRVRSSLGKWLGPLGVTALVAASAAGGGCDGGSSVECDANGQNCQVCDGYGCHPANATPGTTTAGGTTASGGAGQGGATTGQGGSATGTGGAGGAGGSGGAPPCDPSMAVCPCEAGDTCATEGTQCLGGLCVKGCEHSYQCGPGKVCANGACAAGCAADVPCAEPGTTCDKGVCVPDPQHPACSDAAPCAGGEKCVGGLCQAPCVNNAACAGGEVCDGATGTCIPDPSPKPLCGQGQECVGVGQQCGQDGFCHYPCSDLAQCQLIDSRFVACDGGVCKTEEEVAPECSLEKPCAEGKDCISNKCL